MERITKRVIKRKSRKNCFPILISLYTMTQCYGGPEEGGWWYDVVEFIEVLKRVSLKRNCEVMSSAFTSLYSKHYEKGDYLNGYVTTIPFVERRPYERDNSDQPRPYYC